MSEAIETAKFSAGQVIIREGEPGDCAYLVHTGDVQVYRMNEGQIVVLANIAEGQIFGEMALIDGQPRSANVRALRKTICVRITEAVLQKVIAGADPIVKALLISFVRNVRDLARRASAVGTLDSLQSRR
ncbi:MAG: cyclic nucleotide-binding domain-containing protein [Alphaproteobacteria bacterium]|nr:cyclic nucleotide-binding domain-containing protein [Alphaproteobacteria bacterium]